ncbi:hypothetical protein JP74_09310 [Devosia sp. 17-2-E-8]|nr:hypothetical protein JP74_09310 [Devosia sp. 17-2-E-8]
MITKPLSGRRFLPAAFAVAVSCSHAMAFEPWQAEYWRTPEFFTQWGLETIGAEYAYAGGLDGTGVNIGVLDAGIDMSHPEFAGRNFQGWALDGVRWDSGLNSHGTMVASVLAANRDGKGTHGVAPGVTLLEASLLNRYGEIDDAAVAGGLNWLIGQNTDFILYELGHTGWTVRDYDVETAYRVITAPVIDAFHRAVDDGIVLIVPTHNDFLDDPSVEAGLPYLFPELEENWLAVSGYYYGNKCGVAKNYCLTAPADDIYVAVPGGGYDHVWGTSFAGPHVAGVAALVKQRFPYMTANQIKQVLLGTAWDENGDGVDDVFGYGLLQAWAAVLGPGKFDWNDFHVVQPNGVSSWYNAISGDYGLIKSGDGVLILRADNTYLGDTRVDGGDLVIEGSIASRTFIDAGGTLTGDGTIYGDLENRGTFQPGWGSDGGVMTIEGDYTQFTGATTAIYLGGKFGPSLASISGTASLSGNLAAHVLAGGYTGDAEYEVLQAGAIGGAFDAVIDDMAFLDTSLRIGANSIYLGISRNATTFRSMAVGSNGAGAAGVIENLGIGNGVFDAVIGLSAAEAGEAFEQLSGAGQASVATSLIATGSMVGSMANVRLRSAAGSAGATEIPVMSYMPSASPLMISVPQGPSYWASAQAGWGSGGAQDRFSAGQLVGVDNLFGDWRIGALVGFGKTATNSPGMKADGTDYHLGLYAGTEWGNLALRTGATYTRHDLETTRTLSLGGAAQTLTASYGGNSAQAFAEIGYGIEAGDFRFEPFAGLAYLNIWTEGFAETGGAAALSGSGMSVSTVLSTVGINAQTKLVVGETETTLRAGLGWQHAFGIEAPVATHAFAGSGSFDVTGQSIDGDTALLQAGIDLPLSENAKLGLTYGGQVSANSRSHGVKAELRVSF